MPDAVNASTVQPVSPDRDSTFGLILDGGLGRRMGGADKGLVTLAGRPMLAHVIGRLRPQCAALAISANVDPLRCVNAVEPRHRASCTTPGGLPFLAPSPGKLIGAGATHCGPKGSHA